MNRFVCTKKEIHDIQAQGFEWWKFLKKILCGAWLDSERVFISGTWPNLNVYSYVASATRNSKSQCRSINKFSTQKVNTSAGIDNLNFQFMSSLIFKRVKKIYEFLSCFCFLHADWYAHWQSWSFSITVRRLADKWAGKALKSHVYVPIRHENLS